MATWIQGKLPDEEVWDAGLWIQLALAVNNRRRVMLLPSHDFLADYLEGEVNDDNILYSYPAQFRQEWINNYTGTRAGMPLLERLKWECITYTVNPSTGASFEYGHINWADSDYTDYTGPSPNEDMNFIVYGIAGIVEEEGLDDWIWWLREILENLRYVAGSLRPYWTEFYGFSGRWYWRGAANGNLVGDPGPWPIKGWEQRGGFHGQMEQWSYIYGTLNEYTPTCDGNLLRNPNIMASYWRNTGAQVAITMGCEWPFNQEEGGYVPTDPEPGVPVPPDYCTHDPVVHYTPDKVTGTWYNDFAMGPLKYAKEWYNTLQETEGLTIEKLAYDNLRVYGNSHPKITFYATICVLRESQHIKNYWTHPDYQDMREYIETPPGKIACKEVMTHQGQVIDHNIDKGDIYDSEEFLWVMPYVSCSIVKNPASWLGVGMLRGSWPLYTHYSPTWDEPGGSDPWHRRGCAHMGLEPDGNYNLTLWYDSPVLVVQSPP